MKKINLEAFIIKTILFFGVPFTFLSSVWLKLVRKKGINEMIFIQLGILPILDHYYQPMINPNKYLKKSLRDDRT